MRRFTASLLSIFATLVLFIAISQLINTHPKNIPKITDRPQLTLLNDFSANENLDRNQPKLAPPEQPQSVKSAPRLVAPNIAEFQLPQVDRSLSMLPPNLDKNISSFDPYLGEPGNNGIKNQALTPLVRIPPVYPRRAAIKGIEGWVELEFTVLESGSVTNVKILKAQPRRIFDQAAINAISAWRFKPRIADGKPVRQRATQTITFSLSQ